MKQYVASYEDCHGTNGYHGNQLLHLYSIPMCTEGEMKGKNGIIDFNIYVTKSSQWVSKKEILIFFSRYKDEPKIYYKVLTDDSNIKAWYRTRINDDIMYLDIFAEHNGNYAQIYSQITFSTSPAIIETVCSEVVKSSTENIVEIVNEREL